MINGEIYLRIHCSKIRRVVDFVEEVNVSVLFLNFNLSEEFS